MATCPRSRRTRPDRRLAALLNLAAWLPLASAAQAQAQAPSPSPSPSSGAPTFPPPLADIPTSHIEATALAARNAATVRRQNGLPNQGKLDESVHLFAPDTRNHGVAVGRAGLTCVLTDIVGTFPDYHSEEFDLMAAGDEVVVRQINTGAHLGVSKVPFNGGLLVGAPPTGKTFKVQSIHWCTLKDDQIVEHRASRDDIGMMQQLGLLPMTPRYDLQGVNFRLAEGLIEPWVQLDPGQGPAPIWSMIRGTPGL